MMKRPTLIDDWRRVARKAWSVRLAWIASGLSAAEVGIQLLAPRYPGPWFAACAVLVSLGAAYARLVLQPRMRNGRDE